MRVGVVSDFFSNGGAAIACDRIVKGLIGEGCEVVHLAPSDGQCNQVDEPHRRIVGLPPAKSLAGGVLDRVFRDPRRATGRAWWNAQLRDAIADANIDLLNVHNIHHSPWDHESLLMAAGSRPIAWTLHDQWATHPFAFRYHVRGQEVRVLGDSPARLARARAQFFDRPGVALIGPSQWIVNEAKNGFPAVRSVVIPNGVSLEEFSPRNSATSRQDLGISPDQLVLMLSSLSLDDPRKGSDVVAEALLRLKDLNPVVLRMGAGDGAVPNSMKTVSLGVVGDRRLQALAYSAADFFICASRADNLPNVILEALACAVPVIASRVGGIPEAVVEGSTGWLFETEDAAACARKIREAWTAPVHVRKQMRNACRSAAVEHYDIARQARRYLEFFQETIRGSSIELRTKESGR